MSRTTTRVRSGRLELALHTLRPGAGPALLLLHGLGSRTPDEEPSWTAAWPGSVHGLDFTGHGDSQIARAGGYAPEALMADVDAALGHLGPASVVGSGLGAWIALLIAGGRPALVRGIVLADGPGLAGGGASPPAPYVEVLPVPATSTPDPTALLELSRDVRPPDYALDFVRLALDGSEVTHPIVVAAHTRPPWLAAVAEDIAVERAGLVEAVALLARG